MEFDTWTTWGTFNIDDEDADIIYDVDDNEIDWLDY